MLLLKLLCHSKMHYRNVIICPISLHICMGLILVGSTGRTSKEVAKVLCLDKFPLDKIRRAFKELLSPLRGNESIQIANKIYMNNEFHVKPEFHELAANVFISDTETLDFSSEIALETVNEWVENRTSRSDIHILKPGALDNSEILVVNAIRFHGSWLLPFSKQRTSHGMFYVSEWEHIQVDMMHASVSKIHFNSMQTRDKYKCPFKCRLKYV